MMKKFSILLMLSVLFCSTAVFALADSSAVYCNEMNNQFGGYHYVVQSDNHSNEYGVCILPDGTRCDSWSFLHGRCGNNLSYCARNGYETDVISNGTSRYAACVLPGAPGNVSGNTILNAAPAREIPVVEIMNLSGKLGGSITPRAISTQLNQLTLAVGAGAPSSQSMYNATTISYWDWRNPPANTIYAASNFPYFNSSMGWMTSIKDQGSCGSCWSFGTLGSIEAKYDLGMNESRLKPDLSEQDEVSCDLSCYSGYTRPSSACQNGCNGGYVDLAMQNIQSNGVVDESCFPYTATNTSCSNICPGNQNRDWSITGYQENYNVTNAALEQMLVDNGPIAVLVDARQWDPYTGGLECSGSSTYVDHAVVLVGYNDTGDNGTSYWIIKNSWGSDWGENGYIRVQFGCDAVGLYNYYSQSVVPPNFKPAITVNAPADGAITSQNPVLFNFTVYNNVAATSTCDLLVDGAIANTTAANNGTATVVGYNLPGDGQYNWSLRCWESNFGIIDYSQNRSLTLDTTPPSVVLNSPADLSISNSSAATFSFTAVDNLSATMNCSLYLDNVLNQGNASTLNNTATTFMISAIPDGNHTWYVQCLDKANNIGTSATRGLTTDTTAPAVTLDSPDNQSVSNSSEVAFSFTAVDNLSAAMNCSLYLDNIPRRSNPSVQNDTPAGFTISSIPDGSHSWFAECQDAADNAGISETRAFSVATTGPTVNLNSPDDGAIFNVSAVNFNFTPSHFAYPTISCSLYLDGTLNQTNGSALNATSATFRLSIADGHHNGYVQCTDASNTTAASAPISFTVDTHAPTLTLNSPANLSLLNASSLNFSFTPADNLPDPMSCSIYLDGSLNQTNPSTQNGTPAIFAIQGINDGSHSWYVQCTDSAGNLGSSAKRNFTIYTHPPSVTLNSPANLSLSNSSTSAFSFTAISNLSKTMNCSIFLDGVLIKTNASTLNNTTTVFSISPIPDGNHIWYVQCLDNAYNIGTSLARNFTIDTTPPSVTLSSPADLSQYNYSSITFNFTAVDSLSATMNCSIFLDGALNQTDASTPNSAATLFTISGISDGNHTWYVQCKDNANNTGTSPTNRFSVLNSCPVISSSGTRVLSSNAIGAPNGASPLADSACVKIAASNVIFDCNGYNITDNSIKGTTYGILINGSLKNVTLRNCPNISNYGYGIYVYQSNNTNITNSAVYNDTLAGIDLASSNNTIIKNVIASTPNVNFNIISSSNDTFTNTVTNSVGMGFYIASNSNEETFINTSGISNGLQGYYLTSSSNNTFINSTGASNSMEGIYLDTGSNNSFINFTGTSSTNIGILIFDNSNDAFLNTNGFSNTSEAFELESSPNNSITNSTGASNTSIGLMFTSSPNNSITNSTGASNSQYGIFLSGSPNDTFISATGTSNSSIGIYLSSTSNDTFISATGTSNSSIGIYLSSSPNNTFANTSGISNSSYGIYILSSNNNALTRFAGISNSNSGIYLSSSSNNSITSSVGASNSSYGIYLTTSSNNSITNSTGSSHLGYGIFLYSSSNNSIANSTGASNPNMGILLYSSSNNIITNSTGDSNSNYGIYIYSSSNNNTIVNSAGVSNSSYGILLYSSSNNTLVNSTGSSRSGTGIYLYLGSSNTIANSTVSGNPQGLYINSSSAAGLSNVHFYNNSVDISVSGPSSFNMGSSIFDSPLGSYQNFTNLSINDSVNTGESYSIAWSSNPSTLPSNYSSFSQKFVNISALSGTPSIDSIAWTWIPGELGGYNENRFSLFGFSGSWTLLNDSPSSHELSMAGLSPGAIFGVMELNSAGPDVALNSPTNMSISNSSAVSFNYTATDDFSTSLVCSIFLDGALNQTNASATSGMSSAFTISGISDGSHAWYVQCTDNAGNTGTSVTSGFTIATYAPSVTLDSPADLSISNSSAVSFSFTAVDNGSPTMDCSLYLDNVLNQANASTLNDTPTAFPSSAIPDGNHSWYVQCMNDVNNTGESVTRNFIVDTSAPALTVQNPVGGSFYSSANISLDYSVSDPDLQSCWYTINAGATNTTLPGCPNTSFIASAGNNTIIVYANDSAGNQNSSTVAFTVVTAPPSVLLNSPANLSLSNSSAIAFNFTPTDNLSATLSCSLYLDNLLNQTNASVLSNTATTFSINAIPDGNHTWYVQCTDYANSTGTSLTRSFSIDTSAPIIAINSPANNTVYNSSSVLVNISVVEAHPSNTWFFNGTANQTYTVPVNKTYADGSYNMTVWSNDTLGHLSSAVASFSVDTISPRISFVAPTFNSSSLLKFNYIEINVTASDAHLSNITIRLYNSSRALINSTTTTSANKFSNFTNLPDGTYYFNATAYDAAGHTNSTPTWNVTLDATAPVITVISPVNKTLYNTSTIRINISVVEAHPAKTWFFNGTANQTYTSPVNVTYANGNYNLTVWSNDTLGHLSSAVASFSVDTISPKISFVAPTFNSSSSLRLTYIEINVTASDAHLSNVTIRLYNSSRALINSTNTTNPNLFANFTHLAYGTYYFNATARDAAGHANSTATWYVTIHS